MNFLSQAFILVKDILAYVFVNGDIITKKTFLFIALAVALSIGALKIANSSISFILSTVVAALTIVVLPDRIVLLLMTPFYAAAIAILFVAITMIFTTVWWIRKFLLGLAAVAGFVNWYFYGKEFVYLMVAIGSLILLTIDNPLHRALIGVREKAKGKDVESVRKRIKAKKLVEAVELGATQKEADEYSDEESGLNKKQRKAE